MAGRASASRSYLDAVVEILASGVSADLAIVLRRAGRSWSLVASWPPYRPAAMARWSARERWSQGIQAVGEMPLPSVVVSILKRRPDSMLAGPLGPSHQAAVFWCDGGGAPPSAAERIAALASPITRLLDTDAADAEARTLAQRFRVLFAELPSGLMFVGDDAASALLNQRAARLLDLPPGLSPAAGVARRMIALRQRASNHEELEGAYAHLAADRSATIVADWQIGDRVYQVATHQVGDAGSDGRLWVFDDVTETRRRDRLLAETRHFDAIGELSGGIAHEFNNLLTVVVGNLHLLSWANITDEDRELLSAARAAADRGSRLVAQLLDYAQRQTLVLETTDVAKVVRDVADRGRREHPLRRFLVQVPESSVTARVDAARLGAAMSDLVENAVEASDAATEIVLRLATGDWSPGGQVVEGAGDWALLQVVDRGTGMTPAVLARACEPFFTTRGMAVSRGLGLSSVQGYARQTGGGLILSSSPGRGTTATLVLPRQPS
jgi:signal transduction histidine kinase